MSTAIKEEVSFDEACAFVVKLGTLVHGYGTNAIRLESYLGRLTEALGFQGVFRSTPTEMYFAFSRPGELWQRMHLVTMPGTGLELNRLGKIDGLIDAIAARQVSLAEATDRLDEIDKTPHPWGPTANALGYAFAGSGFAVLLGGSSWDVALSALFSLVVFAMVAWSGRLGVRTAAWLPLSTAFVAGGLTASAKLVVPELNGVLVTLSAILILIPGYPISVGVIEIVCGRAASGTANLVSGLVYLAKQFSGAWLGVGLVGLCCLIPDAAGTPVRSEWLWLFMPLLIAALCVVFQTGKSDFLWAVLGCGLAYGGILLGGEIAGANLGNLVGTIIAVCYANLWARKTNRPTSIVLLPAIVLLVSGSIGFRGLAAAATGDSATGAQQFLQMFVVALTIAAGLLVGNTIVRPKATL